MGLFCLNANIAAFLELCTKLVQTAIFLNFIWEMNIGPNSEYFN
jgi:hypothetical protein